MKKMTKKQIRDHLWDLRFMAIAQTIRLWSKDPSTQCGAVIVNPATHMLLSTGYNGFPRHIKDKPARLNDRETRIRLTVHAECNAIFNAGMNGVELNGATMYVYGLPPCEACSLAIIQAGIARVVTSHALRHVPERWVKSCTHALENLDEAGIIVKTLPVEVY